ncbi:uncharacterized protein ARMOST_18820 [Armillaria ostoyae]|uniref:F-box domain-containing protein n=1 Tax=Armillaria ostoyae TaxID=47428 RepID=A0A284S2X6_ARMOS|nr:uncharacterized protein ARMOST_18820 [Armillaria ostoyae]
MPLLDLPHELLSHIVNFMDSDTLVSLCVTEKHILRDMARRLLRQNVTVHLDTIQKSQPNLFSFDSARLAAIRSLSISVVRCFDIHPGLLPLCPLIRLILENTMASLVTLELHGCNAEPQDFSEMMSITIRKLFISRSHPNVRFLLGPLNVEELVVHGPGLDDECMRIGVTLRRLTDAHLGKLRRLCLVNTCRDAGCRDVLHLTHVLEARLSSIEDLVLDIPLSRNTHQNLLRVTPAFPALKNSRIISRTNETSPGFNNRG